VTERFAKACEPVAHGNCGQDVGGVGALTAVGVAQALLLAEHTHGRKQTLPSASSNEAGTNVAQHRGVEAGVSAFERAASAA